MECFFRSPPYGRLSGTQRDKEKETLRRKRVDTNRWGIGGGYLLCGWKSFVFPVCIARNTATNAAQPLQ